MCQLIPAGLHKARRMITGRVSSRYSRLPRRGLLLGLAFSRASCPAWAIFSSVRGLPARKASAAWARTGPTPTGAMVIRAQVTRPSSTWTMAAQLSMGRDRDFRSSSRTKEAASPG